MNNSSGYGVIYNSVIDTEGVLSANAKLTYCILCRYADINRQCFPTVSTIAQKAGLSKRQTEKALKELREKEVIHSARQKMQHGSNLYTINDNALLTCVENVPKSKNEGLHTVKNDASTCVENCTTNNTIINNTMNNTITNNNDALHRICYLLNVGNAKESYKGRIKPDSQMTRIYFDELKRKGVNEEEMLRVAEIHAKHGFKGSMLDFSNLWDRYGNYKDIRHR